MDLRVKDVSKLLNISEKTVYQWIKKEELPAYQISGQYRFSRSEILEWSSQKKVKVNPDIINESGNIDNHLYKLSDAITDGGIYYDIKGETKKEVIYSISQLVKLPEDTDKEDFYKFLIARENLGTTAIGEGIAIPHVRNPVLIHADQPLVVLCFLQHPVDFNALDHKDVKIIFTLISPNTKVHLHLLATIMYILKNEKVQQLLKAKVSEDKILSAFKEAESVLEKI